MYDISHPKVEPIPETGCWLWTGSLTRLGYADVWRDRKGKSSRAHRAFYEQVNGDIPRGLVIDHTCRVRCCMNPDHMRAVPQAVNAVENSDSPSALYKARVCCPKCGGPFVVRKSGGRECRPCKSANDKIWRAENRDRLLAYYKQWREENPQKWAVYRARAKAKLSADRLFVRDTVRADD